MHTPTGTIHFEDDEGIRVAVSTVNCSCGHHSESRHDAEDDPEGLIAEEAAWESMAEHLGYDPRDVPVGVENTSPTN